MAKSVYQFENAILSEIGIITNEGTSDSVYDLIEHAQKEEKKAESRELRPRPEEQVDAEHFRSIIDFNFIPSTTLQQNVTGLIDYLEELEKLLNNAN